MLASRCLFVLAALLAAGAQASARATPADTPVFDLTTTLSSVAPSYVELRDRSPLRAVRRIAIVSFVVEYVESKEVTPARREDREKKSVRSGPAAIAIALDPDELQSITDTLYDTAVETWRAAGIDVLPPESVAALPGFAALTPALTQAPYRDSTNDDGGSHTSRVVSAHGRPAYAAGRTPPESAEHALAKESDVTVASARFVVDFLALRDSHDRLFRRKVTPVYVESIRAPDSGYRLVVPGGAIVAATLAKPVRAPDSPVAAGAPQDDDDTQDSQGSVTALPAPAYYDQALRYLGAAQDMILAELTRSIPGQR